MFRSKKYTLSFGSFVLATSFNRDIKKVHIVIQDNPAYYEFFNNEDISDIIKQANEAIDHAFNFWEHPMLSKPDVNFVMTNNSNEIEKSQNNYDEIFIYPLKDTGESIFLDVFFITESDTIFGKMGYQKQIAGFFSANYNIRILRDSLSIFTMSACPFAAINPSNNAIDS